MMSRLALPAFLALITVVATLHAAGPASARSNILWRDCFEVFECGTMKVPLKHDEPARGDIELALVRAPALDQDQDHRIGSLLVNFGGPGGPGVEGVLSSVDFFPFELRERFDIVGFDPRGVGQSSAIDCIDSFSELQADPSPDDVREVNDAIEEARAFGEDCRRRSASLIQYVNSESVARDMDLIREELGDEKLSYIGFSYGTFLGATYAQYFPENVRALLLDAAMNPAATPEEDIVQQASFGFERALDAFFANCAADPNCPFKAADLEAEFDALLKRADVAPLEGWDFPIDKDAILQATSGALYNREVGWLLLAEAMRQAVDNNSGVGFGVLLTGIDTDDEDVDFTNGYEAFLAVACVDFWSLKSEQQWREVLAAADEAAPHFGGSIAFISLPCLFWPNAERRAPGPYAATGSAPIVVIGGLRDPATPYEWSVALADQLDSGVLVTYDGDGHTAVGKNSCIDNVATRYLVELTVPSDGAFCDNEYEPFPGPATLPPLPSSPPVNVGEGAAPTGAIRPPDTGSGDAREAASVEAAALIAAWFGVAGSWMVVLGRRVRS